MERDVTALTNLVKNKFCVINRKWKDKKSKSIVDFWNKKLNKTELCKLILRSLIVPFSSANIMNNSLQQTKNLEKKMEPLINPLQLNWLSKDSKA